MPVEDGPSPVPEAGGDPPRFWKEMTYACSHGCGWERRVLLEVGCEGPRNGADQWTTPGGRTVVPVPFVAAGCLNCQGTEPPWDMSGPVLQHVRWREDSVLVEERVGVPDDQPHFRYPATAGEVDQAAGLFVVPGVLELERFR